MSATLSEMGPLALQHRDELEEVKRRVGITHEYFDCWIYSFLENKFFDVNETVAKLQRRDNMEREDIANYEVTDFMREQMSKGLIQLIGNDKEGRVTFYIVTARDKPLSSKRDENKRNFDMWVSYGTRLRKDNKRCRITMLINQDGAGVWANTDMTFQMNIALRISKFFPGMVERAYICKMGSTLGAFAKTVFARFPKVISEKIFIITDSDLRKGLLYQYFEKDVLPVALGGTWDGDNKVNWQRFSNTIEQHLLEMQKGLRRGLGVKEWELEQLRLTGQLEDAARDSPTAHGDDLEEGEYDDFDEAEFKTCVSDDPLASAEQGQYSHHPYARDAVGFGKTYTSGLPAGKRISPMLRRSFAGLDTSSFSAGGGPNEYFWRFFFSQEGMSRRKLIDDERTDRLRLVDRHTAGYYAQANNEDMIGVQGSQKLARYIPEGARSCFRFLLLFSCVLTAILFGTATVFFTAFISCIAVTLFLGIFEGPFFIFPVGCALSLVLVEGSMIITRGVELTTASFYGHLLPPLRPFRKIGPILQAILFAIIIGIQFIVFTTYASEDDALTGLRTSFASGWLTCAIVIVLYHVVSYPLGLTGRSPSSPPASPQTTSSHGGGSATPAVVAAHRSNRNHFSELSLYLFFNITEEEDEDDTRTAFGGGGSGWSGADSYVSANLIGFVPAVLATLLGVGFMLSRLLLFAVATPVMTIGAAFLTSYVVFQRTDRHSTRLMQIVTWMVALVWLFVVFAMGFEGWSSAFGGCVILVSLLCALFVGLSLAVSAAAPNKSWVFRGTLILLVVLAGVSFILMFAIVHWSLGVFFLIMMIHCAACIRKETVISAIGSGLLLAGVVTLLIACVLVGYSSTPMTYLTPHSTPSAIATPSASSDNLESTVESFFRSPLCLLLFASTNASEFIQNSDSPSAATIDITDLALLNEIAFAATPTPFSTDLTNWWFPSSPSSPSLLFGSSSTASSVASTVWPQSVVYQDNLLTIRKISTLVPHGDAPASPFSVLLFSGSLDPFQHIRSTVIWVDSMAFSPLILLLPQNVGWSSGIIRTTSFASFMIPFQWRSTLLQAQGVLFGSGGGSSSTLFDESVVVTGSRLTGGIASIVAVRMNYFSVTFGAPSLTDVSGKFALGDTSIGALHRNVEALGGAAAGVGGDDEASVFLQCGVESKSAGCQSDAFFSFSLIQVCERARPHTGSADIY